MITLGSRWMFSLIVTTCVRLMLLFVSSVQKSSILRRELVKLKRKISRKSVKEKSLHVSLLSLPSHLDGASSMSGEIFDFWHRLDDVLTDEIEWWVFKCRKYFSVEFKICCFESSSYRECFDLSTQLTHISSPPLSIINSKEKWANWLWTRREKQICEIFNKLCSVVNLLLSLTRLELS